MILRRCWEPRIITYKLNITVRVAGFPHTLNPNSTRIRRYTLCCQFIRPAELNTLGYLRKIHLFVKQLDVYWMEGRGGVGGTTALLYMGLEWKEWCNTKQKTKKTTDFSSLWCSVRDETLRVGLFEKNNQCRGGVRKPRPYTEFIQDHPGVLFKKKKKFCSYLHITKTSLQLYLRRWQSVDARDSSHKR